MKGAPGMGNNSAVKVCYGFTISQADPAPINATLIAERARSDGVDIKLCCFIYSSCAYFEFC